MNRSVTWANFDAYLAQRQAGSANINNVRGATLAGNPRIGNGVAEVNALHGAVSPARVIQLAVKIYF